MGGGRKIILNKVELATSLDYYPDVVTLTLQKCKESSLDSVQASIETAVTSLLDKYPALSGSIYICPEKILWLQESTISTAVLDTFFKTQTIDNAPPDNASEADYYAFLSAHAIPNLDSPKPSSFHVENPNEPLFRVDFVRLPPNHYVLAMTVAHAIIDAASYYALLDELVALMNGQEPSGQPLEWGDEAIAVHNLVKDQKHDAAIVMGPPIFKGMGAVMAERQETGDSSSFYVIDKARVDDQKALLVDSSINSYLSSNDIIVAALTQAKTDAGLLSYPVNQRRDAVAQKHKAGFFVALEFANVDVARDPNRFRQGERLAPGTLPQSVYETGKQVVITSWATARSKEQQLGAHQILFHCPHPTFVKDVPVHMAIVFDVTNDCLGILHNFPKNTITGESSALLKKLIKE